VRISGKTAIVGGGPEVYVFVLEYNDSGNVKMSHCDLSMWTGEGAKEEQMK
jgi:hypothetical protein